MRKLILTVAVAILTSGVSMHATNNNNTDQVICIALNDEFKEIALTELPAVVSEAILKEYKTATIAKAFVNESEQYKITLKVEETESVVFADKEGKLLKEADVTSTEEEKVEE